MAALVPPSPWAPLYAGCMSTRGQAHIVAMTTSTTAATIGVQPDPALALRLTLPSTGPGHGKLDGAWWPRSRDLAAELPALVTGLEARGHRVARAAVHTSAWPHVPAEMTVGPRVVVLDTLDAEQDVHTIRLHCPEAESARLDLLVVPPQCPSVVAARVTAAVAAVWGVRSASVLLADAGYALWNESGWADRIGADGPMADGSATV